MLFPNAYPYREPINVVPSAAARVALLRSLLRLQNPKSKNLVNLLLKGEFKKSLKENGYLDSPLAVCYTSVQEEALGKELTSVEQAVAAVPRLDMESLRAKSHKANRLMLDTIARLRRCLIVFANEVCACINPDGNGEALALVKVRLEGLEKLSAAFEPLLVNAKKHKFVRSVRMFLLKVTS